MNISELWDGGALLPPPNPEYTRIIRQRAADARAVCATEGHVPGLFVVDGNEAVRRCQRCRAELARRPRQAVR